MTSTSLPVAVERFVAANNAHDADALVALFGPGASVADDGMSLTTEADIRAWIQSHLIAPRIVMTPRAYDAGRLTASSDGDFPGAPLDFRFDFELEGDAITRLAITPA